MPALAFSSKIDALLPGKLLKEVRLAGALWVWELLAFAIVLSEDGRRPVDLLKGTDLATAGRSPGVVTEL